MMLFSPLLFGKNSRLKSPQGYVISRQPYEIQMPVQSHQEIAVNQFSFEINGFGRG